jgi:NAD(P)H-dependent flavin oxidoreductase YrpB (nitropropane dioxygenase family)
MHHLAPWLSAEKAGVDAVTILGAEAGGHPGMQLIGTMVQGARVPGALGIPVVLAGGMGTGRQLVACLALEADGIDDFEAYRGLVAGEIQRQAYETGDWNRGTPSVGQGSSFADWIEPVEDIFDRIMADADAVRLAIEGTK